MGGEGRAWDTGGGAVGNIPCLSYKSDYCNNIFRLDLWTDFEPERTKRSSSSKGNGSIYHSLSVYTCLIGNRQTVKFR